MSGDGGDRGEEKGLELSQNPGNNTIKAATYFVQALGSIPPCASRTIPNLSVDCSVLTQPVQTPAGMG